MQAKWTWNKFLIPARNSRHRTACLALYRHLLRLAPKVELPDHITLAFGTRYNPISHVIRRSFQRNRADVSPRLIYPALKAGYHALSVLHSAASDEETPEYSSVIAFLSARAARRGASLAARAANPPRSQNPNANDTGSPLAKPVLVRVSPDPDAGNSSHHFRPQYATPHRPRPKEELGGSGRRHIPVIDMAQNEFPFLRFGKPQPPALSQALIRKLRARTRRSDCLRQMYAEHLQDAKEEDQWESYVNKLLSTETNDLPNFEPSYDNTLWTHGVVYLNEELTKGSADNVARADAMRALIAQEKQLAEQERAERIATRRRKWEERMKAEHGHGWEAAVTRLNEKAKRERDELRSMYGVDQSLSSKKKKKPALQADGNQLWKDIKGWGDPLACKQPSSRAPVSKPVLRYIDKP